MASLTIKTKLLPYSNINSRLRLYRNDTGALVQEVTTGEDGEYTFTDLDEIEYFLTAQPISDLSYDIKVIGPFTPET